MSTLTGGCFVGSTTSEKRSADRAVGRKDGAVFQLTLSLVHHLYKQTSTQSSRNEELIQQAHQFYAAAPGKRNTVKHQKPRSQIKDYEINVGWMQRSPNYGVPPHLAQLLNNTRDTFWFFSLTFLSPSLMESLSRNLWLLSRKKRYRFNAVIL